MTEESLERDHHLLLFGLLLYRDGRYEVRSERISGRGRYDLMLVPTRRGDPGVCLELKAPKRGTARRAAEVAFQQIEKKRYTVELEKHGARPIYAMALVVQKQQVFVQSRRLDAP